MDTISFGATQTLVDERDGAAQVLLLREGDLIGPVTVNYITGDDTASAGADYTAGLTSVTFAAGEAQKLIRIPVANDALAEGSESFSIEITGASANSQPVEPAGRNCCLKTSLPMSAIACSRPNGPTRFGP